MKSIGVALALAFLLSGCGSLKFWGKEDVAEPATTADADVAAAGDPEALTDAQKKAQKKKDKKADEPNDLKKIDASIDLKRLWSLGVGEGQEPQDATLVPALVDGVVYAASRDGRVIAADAAEGERRWRTDLDLTLTGGVGVGGGLVLIGGVDGDLIALRADSGEEAWRVALSSEMLAPAAANADVVVVATQDARVFGLSVPTGKQLWTYEGDRPLLTLRATATPVMAESMAVVGFANGKLVAFDAVSGTVVWEARVAMPGGRTELERMVDVNTPVLGGDILYAVSYQGRVAAYSRGTGRELWARDASSHRAPSLGANQVYIVGAEDQVIALRATGGQELWVNRDLRLRNLSAPQAIGDVVAVADVEGYLHLLSQVDGRIVGRVKVDSDGVSTSLASDGERLYVLDNSGALTAYGLRAH
ncbi:MAG: outer membrane protein assembly factor BamB [Porticoccaceae bacterium]